MENKEVRIERVEVVFRGADEKLGGEAADGAVFNLQVGVWEALRKSSATRFDQSCSVMDWP